MYAIGSYYVTGAQTTIIRDPEISKMVNEISRERIESYVRKLVSFHTRHNLSVQNDTATGIGAAWNWIKGEMEKSIKPSGGRLEVNRITSYNVCYTKLLRLYRGSPGGADKS